MEMNKYLYKFLLFFFLINKIRLNLHIYILNNYLVN